MTDEQRYLTQYDETGRIKGIMQGSAASLALNEIGLFVYGQSDIKTDYVLDRVITPRPAQATTLNGDTLENLPVPCTITINGQDYAWSSPTAELDLDQIALYKIKVVAWPYLDKEFTYETVAP